MCNKVSVIIPVYNVEQYIERCARSLMVQTMKDGIEFLFINDCTPDKSIEILQKVVSEYPERKDQVRIITMEQNSGQAAVRRRGMLEAKGEYQIHCDSDDWVEPDIYDRMYQKAKTDGADVVTCNFWKNTGSACSEIVKNIDNPDPHYHINYVSHNTWWSLWARLIRTSLIRQYEIFPIPGMNMWEDMYINIRVYYYANRISHLPEPLYHYVNSEGSIVARCLDDHILQQQVLCILRLEEFFSSVKFDASKFLNYRKCNTKNKYLQKRPIDFDGFKRCFPEVNTYMFECSLLYKWCWALAARGWFLPYRLFFLYL